MFYSQLLLSKKGSLGIVWMAAHCHRRLRKDQVMNTNISSSVAKILDDEVPSVTHRILAFLLLGVVRIYSKKVEYLFNDCQQIMNKLHGFRLETGKGGSTGASERYYHSIKIPKRLELDAFDLEHSDSQDLECENVRPSEELLLEGGCRIDCDTRGLICKDIIPFAEASSSTSTPLREVFLPCRTGKELFLMPSSNISISLAGGSSFCLEDRLDPIVLDEAEEHEMRRKPHEEESRMNIDGPTEDMGLAIIVHSSINLSHSSPSLEMLRGTQFPLEVSPEHMVLDEAQKDQTDGQLSIDIARTDFQMSIQEMEFSSDLRMSPQGSDFLASPVALNISGSTLGHSRKFKMLSESKKGQGPYEPSGCEGNVEHLMTQASVQYEEEEPRCFTKSTNEAEQVTSKIMKLLKVITLESEEGQRADEFPVSVKAPDVMLPGKGNQGVTDIQTPVTEEHRNIRRKAKILFDKATVLSNKVVKKRSEEDPIHLRRERKTVPSTRLGAWRAQKLANLPQSLLDPYISGLSSDLSSLLYDMTSAPAVKLVEKSCNGHDASSSAIANVVQEQMPDVTSPVMEGSSELTPIAPDTPVTQLYSLRLHDIGAVSDSNTFDPITPPEGLDKLPSLPEGIESDEETSLFDKDSPERDTNSDGDSTRTRMTQDYLATKFLDKERKNEDPVLNISELMKGKTKTDGAKLFYEILVLKSRDRIDVEQANAYGDIMLRQASSRSSPSEE